MIKFFRKIRYDLMEKNKTGKYFKYAIGEILLVVIGILIALQINNWNEGRKNRQLEKEYLHGILKNLEEDIITYKRKIENDTLHLNYATVLQKAFRDKNIRSDRTLMFKAILNTVSYNQFVSSRTVFEDMVSSGNINLIKSDTLRQSVMEYYQFVDDQEAFDQNQEVTEWREHKLEAYNGRLSLHTLIESYTYGKEWQGVIHDFDLSFFTRDANDPAVKDFAYHLSSMKIIMRGKHNRVHIGGLRRAENLKKDIADYLKIPQEIDANSNHQAMTEKPAFEPSSPKNKVPVSREALEDYEGLYQLVKRNTTEVLPGEEDPIIIRIENDHLVIPYILKTTYSMYSIENDKFKRALSFLFSDSGSGGILTFNRNKDNQVNGFILEIEEGIYTYLKVE